MIGFEVKVDNLKQIERLLVGMEKKAAKKIVRKGVRAGANIVRAKARSNAKTMVGGQMGALLAKHIVAKVYKKQRPYSYAIFVGMRAGVSEFVYKAKKWSKYADMKTYIPNAIEAGHVTGKGQPVPGIPFIRNAYRTAGILAKNVALAVIQSMIRQMWGKKAA